MVPLTKDFSLTTEWTIYVIGQSSSILMVVQELVYFSIATGVSSSFIDHQNTDGGIRI